MTNELTELTKINLNPVLKTVFLYEGNYFDYNNPFWVVNSWHIGLRFSTFVAHIIIIYV